jgi:trimeric autotransporter adhesin
MTSAGATITAARAAAAAVTEDPVAAARAAAAAASSAASSAASGEVPNLKAVDRAVKDRAVKVTKNRLGSNSHDELVLEGDTKVRIEPLGHGSGGSGSSSGGGSGEGSGSSSGGSGSGSSSGPGASVPATSSGGGGLDRPDIELSMQVQHAALFTSSADALDAPLGINLTVVLVGASGAVAGGHAAVAGAVEGAVEGAVAGASAVQRLDLEIGSSPDRISCELVCDAPTFVAIARGLLPSSVAVLTRLASTTNLAALLALQRAHVWERERYISFVAERACAARNRRRAEPLGASTGPATPARSGAVDSSSSSSSSSSTAHGLGAHHDAHDDAHHAHHAHHDADAALIEGLKAQMRRRAEEGSSGGAGAGATTYGLVGDGLAGSLVGRIIGAISTVESLRTSENERKAVWGQLRSLTLRGLRGGYVDVSSRAAAVDGSAAEGASAVPSAEGDPLRAPSRALRAAAGDVADMADLDLEALKELDDASLRVHLGGDLELAQGFLFMPHAFLGCDWTGPRPRMLIAC